MIVVYKVDRLTRSLADFAKLVEEFDPHEVSFVSVTQHFNTTSSMGRLTLNVLLSFAQFEREVIGERVRDKIAASKRKGLWVGGPIPLGYASVNKKLVVVPEEAANVRLIFERYLVLGSIGLLIEDLDRRGMPNECGQCAAEAKRHCDHGRLHYFLGDFAPPPQMIHRDRLGCAAFDCRRRDDSFQFEAADLVFRRTRLR